MDLNRNSSECPSFLPTTVSPPLNLTPENPSDNQGYSPPIISKGPVRRIWKRYRSPEELAKRRKRKHDYLLRQRPATPHVQPDTQETYARGEVGVARMLDWSRVDERGDKSVGWASPPPQWSQQLVSPSPPWIPPSLPWIPPSPPLAPPWQASHWAPPPSPAFCNGCNQWGSLYPMSRSV